MSIFQERILELRKENRYTQADFASKFNLTRSTYSGYESEGKQPDFKLVCEIASRFGVTTDWLLGLSDERNHVEYVPFGDTNGFMNRVKAASVDTNATVKSCVDQVYRLLDPDVTTNCAERLSLDLELLTTLKTYREKITSCTAGFVSLSDPAAFTGLASLQNQFRADVSAILDKLAQADLEIALRESKADE